MARARPAPKLEPATKDKDKTAEAVKASAERAPGGGDSHNRRLLRAIAVGPIQKQEQTTGKTKATPQDDFLESLVADGKLLTPPFDKLVLSMLPENSTEMYQVIEAMANNVEGFGHRFECRVKLDDPNCPEKIKAEALAEKAMLANFFNHCCMDESFTSHRKKIRFDKETTGEGFTEVIRSPSTKKIEQLGHIPSYQVRLGVVDDEFTKFTRNVPVIGPDGAITLEPRTFYKRFRRFVQARIGTISRTFSQAQGYTVKWFKEFGDPRVISCEDGRVISEDEQASFPEDKRAGELIHWKIYSPRTPYGLPRYIGNLVTIFGDRAAEEINYMTLRNNNIPSMLLLVSNGQVTDATIQRIREFTEAQISGSENYSRFLLIEGEGQFEGQDQGHIKIEVKPLTSEQMRDQLFQEYGKNNRDKIRENWRLPPIFVGRSEDYTRATAEASRRLADEQVFKPERDDVDDTINRLILADMGIRYYRFVSNGPNVTDDEDLIKVLEGAEKSGALTPRLAREILSDILGKDLPNIDPSKGVDPDIPYSMQMAEAVKNQAMMEVGTQVTALKNLLDQFPPEMSMGAAVGRSVVKDLLEIRQKLSNELSQRLSDGELNS